MNKTVCWYCAREFEYAGEKYRDVNCEYCGSENSIYLNKNETEQQSNNTTCNEWLNEEAEEMSPNLNDLSIFLKRDDLKADDTITFVNEGEIKEVDFSKTKDGSNMKTVFQILIELPDGRNKVATLNKASQATLSDKYGKITEEWVGKKAVVSFVEQMCFGKLTEVLILKPIT